MSRHWSTSSANIAHCQAIKSFALASVLVSASTIDLAQLPDLLARRALSEDAARPRSPACPDSVAGRGGNEFICDFSWGVRSPLRVSTCSRRTGREMGDAVHAGLARPLAASGIPSWRCRGRRNRCSSAAAGSRVPTGSGRAGICRQCHSQAAGGGGRADRRDQRPPRAGCGPRRRVAAFAVFAFRPPRGRGLSLPALSAGKRGGRRRDADRVPGRMPRRRRARRSGRPRRPRSRDRLAPAVQGR